MNPKNEMIKIRIKGIALEIKGIAVCSKLKKPVATGEVRRRRPEGGGAGGGTGRRKGIAAPRYPCRVNACLCQVNKARGTMKQARSTSVEMESVWTCKYFQI
jgi:ribosomal protein L19E